MTTITIPKELADNKELIAVPRNTYEEFLSWQKAMKSIKTFKPTRAEFKALERGRKDFREGRYIEWSKFKQK